MKYRNNLMQLLFAFLIVTKAYSFDSLTVDISTMPNLEHPGHVIKVFPDSFHIFDKPNLLLKSNDNLILSKSGITTDSIIGKINIFRALLKKHGNRLDYRMGVDGIYYSVNLDGFIFNCQNCLDYKFIEKTTGNKVKIGKGERIKREEIMTALNDVLKLVQIPEKRK
jgi:hypothetical protein